MGEFQADRRTLLGGGAMLFGAGALVAPAQAQAQVGASGAADWKPGFEAADAWMEKPGTRHRIAFDTTNAPAASAGLDFANNYIRTSMSGYGLKPDQLGVIVIMRHMATPFAYNDRMWVKYGRKFADMLKLEGEEAIRAVKQNPLLTKPADADPPPKGLEWLNDKYIDRLHSVGVRFAVCGLATEGIAFQLAGKSGDAKAIQAELGANLVPGAVMAPSGIVAVGHAQEHGYSIAYVGPEPN